ncbi:MAG: glycosyltransferase [Gemmatimonadaceae bacterium]
MDDTPRILLAQRAPVDSYPPVLHQAKLLSAIGRVTILDSGPLPVEAEALTSPDVRRIRVQTGSNTRSGTQQRISRIGAAVRFARRFAHELGEGPDVAIAYEPEAAAILLQFQSAARKSLSIVHLHEHPLTGAAPPSVFAHIALRRMLSCLGRAGAVVVADSHRASELARHAGLELPPMVVMNCPMRIADLPDSRLLPLAAERGAQGPIITYHGAVGPGHGLETLIESMKLWPHDSWFFIIGAVDESYRELLRSIAARFAVESRLIFTGRVPYDKVFAFVAGSTIGVSLLDTRAPNSLYAAGASNKRFEYMALGIPQITSAGPGIPELFEDTGVALVADPTDPQDLARAVNRYLASPALRDQASRNARALHLATLHYEAQFSPVLDMIRDRLGTREPSGPQRR